MKSGRNHQGFTIVETLIVLAVTSAILISALSLVGRSQNRTQFSQAINDINSQISSVANNVANGYYASTVAGKTCSAGTGPTATPKFANGVGSLGTNDECIYLGRVIQFTDGENYYFHNIVGRRLAGAPAKEVATMAEARPQIIEPAGAVNSDYPETSEQKILQGGLRIGYMGFQIGAAWHKTSAVAFMGSLASSAANATDLQSGAQSVDTAPAYFSPPLGYDNSANSKIGFIQKFDSDFASLYDNAKNPDSGIVICFDSGTTSQRAIITVGGNQRSGTTALTIQSGKCSDVDPT